jgi:3-hydroxyisobutyrate dehydrogenase
LKILRKSPLFAPQFDKKLSRILKRDRSDPHFTAENLLKDVHLMLDEGQQLEFDASVIEEIENVIEKTLGLEGEHMDYSSIYDVINPP